MSNFENAVNFILKNEGGYSNDEADSGGETYMGISRKYNPMWEGWEIIDGAKENYSSASRWFKEELDKYNIKEKVINFYKKNYWDPLRLSNIKINKVATKILDMSVNLGIPRTASIVQMCVNMCGFNELKLDNIIGSNTINLLNSVTEKDGGDLLLKLLTLQQGHIYMKICQLNSSQEKFIRGWINRLKISIGEFDYGTNM
jgi:lysozyme family protein